MAVVALPAYAVSTVMWCVSGDWISMFLVSAVYFTLLFAAVFRRIDFRKRAWTVFSAGYVMAAVNPTSGGGLESSGRLYLLVLPVFAFILIGTRAGWITNAVSALIYAVFCVLIHIGMLDVFLLATSNPLAFSNWVARGITFFMLLVMIIALLTKMSLELQHTYDETLESLARALEIRDIETAGHSHRVCETTEKLAGMIEVEKDDMIAIHRGSLLHDIGKMGIKDSVLLKPGKLTEEEFQLMQKHTVYAYNLLAGIPYLTRALEIPYCHHEKWDGTGYPRGLKGNEIPLSARIFSVVDVYDALTSDRPYRPAWPREKALAYILERAGADFDPMVVDIFKKFVHNKEENDIDSGSAERGRAFCEKTADQADRPDPEMGSMEVSHMSGRDEDLLAKELEKLAAAGGKIAAKISGKSSSATTQEDSEIMRKAARRLDTDQYSEERTIEEDARSVLQLAYDALKNTGRILEENERESSVNPRISGVVGSGFFGKNPAVVHAEIVGAEEERCTLRLTGFAKEGLIKQGTARKAVEKVLREFDSRG